MKIYLLFGTLLLSSLPAHAGTYLGTDGDSVPTFAIVHPPTYDGTGGQLTVRVCMDTGSEVLAESLRRTVLIWNRLSATTGNCANCGVAEEPKPTTGKFDPLLVLLHELGHCGVGLSHSNWAFTDDFEGSIATSATNSKDASAILEGDDNVFGTSDDMPFPLPGTRLIHWFREIDNNPAVIDSTTIDESTFTRAIGDLPASHSWPANSNRAANELLGVNGTHSPMYSVVTRGATMAGLTADDINTALFGMTGLDETAGSADDYTFHFEISSTCDSPDDILIRFDNLTGDKLGQCSSTYRPIPDPPKQLQHYAVSNSPLPDPIKITLNSAKDWDFSGLFFEEFEEGDFSQWSNVVQ